MGGSGRPEVGDVPTIVLDEEERKNMVGGAFAQAMQSQVLDTRKDIIQKQKDSNPNRVALLLTAQVKTTKSSVSSSSETNSLGRDVDRMRLERAKRMAEIDKRAAAQSNKT